MTFDITKERIATAKKLLMDSHLEFLKGIQNGVRQGMPLDFSGEDLSHANFAGANFHGANLQNANFEKADFSNSDFKSANFRGADLAVVRLGGARLPARLRLSNDPTKSR